jgi:hypothetical protein
MQEFGGRAAAPQEGNNRVKRIIVVFGLLGLALSAPAQNTLDIEGAYVIPGYNDVAIPGDTGTRFSLTDDLDAEETTAFRIRYSHTFSQKHWVGLLVAPLTMDSSGTLDQPVDFNGKTFPEGTSVDASFRFDSYRLIYRYLFHKSDTWQFSFGGAAKVRDAAIKMEGGGQDSEKTNTGVVPLLSFNITWTPVAKVHLLVDGEALAAPQGRAEDVLFAAQYDVNQRLALKTGYRILEGGSDSDEVYTFSLFHYIVAGAVLSF